MKAKFSIGGMRCAACVKHVEDAVKRVNRVKTCSVSLLTETMTVEFECKREDIFSAVKKAGYGISVPTEEKKKDDKSVLLRIVVSAIFLLLASYVAMGKTWFFPLPSFLRDAWKSSIVQLCLCVPCLVANFSYFRYGIVRLVRLKPDMDSLVAVGAGAAFVSGVVTLALYKGEGYLYFESAAMIVTLVTVGKYFEAKSRKKTGEALQKLMELSPEKAIVVRNGEEREIPAEEVLSGEKVAVRQGHSFPCDGVVFEGEGYADESALTGESMPKELQKGSFVQGGTILVGGFVLVTATRTGAETTLHRMIETVEEANANKPRLARIADKVAGVFVPIVIGIAVLTLLGWGIAGFWERGLQCAIAVLVVSCPCALGLATPVAVTVGTGKGAEKGVLFRSGDALEKLCGVRRVLVDKTGTITEGKPEVIDVQEGSKSRNEILAYAAGAESPSSHPLAQAVVAACRKEGIEVPPCSDFSARFGEGVTAAVEGTVLFAGKASFVRENAHVAIAEGEDNTVVHLATEGEYYGCVYLADKPKKDSRETISRLREMGIECIMVTGDNEKTARKIAQEVGIEKVEADILPEGKGEIVKKYKRETVVAMIGDGINDALALSLADVGIAVGTGSDIAKGNADAVLMNGSLSSVLQAIVISRDTVKNIRQNLFWAFFYNCLAIPLAAGILYPLFGWTMSPMIGSITMSLSSLFVVGNALRYKYLDGGKKLFGKKKKDQGIVITVEGMMCEHCKARVEKALAEIGVRGTVDLKKKTVTCPLGCDEQAVKNAIIQIGYEVK